MGGWSVLLNAAHRTRSTPMPALQEIMERARERGGRKVGRKRGRGALGKSRQSVDEEVQCSAISGCVCLSLCVSVCVAGSVLREGVLSEHHIHFGVACENPKQAPVQENETAAVLN